MKKSTAERKAFRQQEAARKMITEQRWLDAQARNAARTNSYFDAEDRRMEAESDDSSWEADENRRMESL